MIGAIRDGQWECQGQGLVSFTEGFGVGLEQPLMGKERTNESSGQDFPAGEEQGQRCGWGQHRKQRKA